MFIDFYSVVIRIMIPLIWKIIILHVFSGYICVTK